MSDERIKAVDVLVSEEYVLLLSKILTTYNVPHELVAVSTSETNNGCVSIGLTQADLEKHEAMR